MVQGADSLLVGGLLPLLAREVVSRPAGPERSGPASTGPERSALPLGLSSVHIGTGREVVSRLERLERFAGLAVYCRGGRSVRIKVPQVPLPFKPGRRKLVGTRGIVNDYSSASRLRCYHSIFAVDQAAVDISRLFFLTLTLPELGYESCPSARVMKVYMKAMRRRFEKRYAGFYGWWKNEPHPGKGPHRGWPHAHILVVLPGTDSIEQLRRWVAAAWFKVIKSQDRRSLRVGTSVDLVESWAKVSAYLGKYVGKIVEIEAWGRRCGWPGDVLAAWRCPGRFWGTFNLSRAPRRRVSVKLSGAVLVKLRRAVAAFVDHTESGEYRCSRVQPLWGEIPESLASLPAAWKFRRGRPLERRVQGYTFVEYGPVVRIRSRESVEVLRENGWRCVPALRRTRRSCCGVSAFMSSEVFERLLKWALSSCGESG